MTAEDTDVIDKADALMRRHRSFVAHSPDAAPPPEANDADIPLLTEIVSAEEASPPPGPDALLEALRVEIDQAISDWLVDALPAAIANASQHILTEIDAKARHQLLPQVQALIDARLDESK